MPSFDSIVRAFASLGHDLVAQKKLEEKQIEEERAAKAQTWKLPVCYDDDDDEERSDSLKDNIISGLPLFSAITPDEPVLSTEEPDNSLIAQKKLEEKQIEEERAAKAQTWKLLVCYDDDDDEERSDSLDDNIISGLPPFSAITPDEPVLSTEEPDNSLSMGDEHLDTILATESDEFIKSGVENLIPIPSESEGIPEHVCDLLSHDNSPPLDVSKDQFEDFSESHEEFSLTDDDSFSIDNIDYVEASPPDSELVSSEVMEIVIPEVGGIKASNDNPIPSYDPIISETPHNLTLSGESDFFLEEDIRLIEKLLYDNSSPRPSKEFVSANSDAAIESFSPSPIFVKDSDSRMKEIDLFCTPDYPMPPSIMDEDYDSERDILIPKDLPSNNSLLFAEK
nr:hypothetical protein [Tanacetum cinerariifolium]